MIQLQAIQPALLTVVVLSAAFAINAIESAAIPGVHLALDPQAGSTAPLLARGASDLPSFLQQLLSGLLARLVYALGSQIQEGPQIAVKLV